MELITRSPMKRKMTARMHFKKTFFRLCCRRILVKRYETNLKSIIRILDHYTFGDAGVATLANISK